MAVEIDRRVVLAVLLGAWSPPPEQPTGNIIHMSTTGDDTNNGAVGTPVRTLQKATSLCAPGDTVYVRGGIYSANQTIPASASGTAQAKTTIMPYPGETAIFDGSFQPSYKDKNLIEIWASYLIFKGFTVRNSKYANIAMKDCAYTEVRNCIIHGAWVNGIQCKSNDPVARQANHHNLIEGNEIYDCVRENQARLAGASWGQAVSCASSYSNTFRNNFIHNNWGEGLAIIVSKDCIVENNHVRDNYSVQLYLDNAQNAKATGNRIWHTYATDYYRNRRGTWRPGQGVEIANENYGPGQFLPSDNIEVQYNHIGGCGNPAVRYSGYDINSGLTNSTITPNTVYSTPEPVRDMTPAWSRPTT